MPQCKQLEKTMGGNENDLLLAHIGSRLAASGIGEQNGTCQRPERPLAGLSRVLKNQGCYLRSRFRPELFLLIFSAVHVEILIKFYRIENQPAYQ